MSRVKFRFSEGKVKIRNRIRARYRVKPWVKVED